MFIELILILHIIFASFMAGVLWYVQIVAYPLYKKVPGERFVAYELTRTRHTMGLVAPVMIFEMLTSITLVIMRKKILWEWLPWVGLGILLVGWGSTLFSQVPTHLRLRRGWNLKLIHKLIRTNWLRTMTWSARALVAALLLVGSHRQFCKVWQKEGFDVIQWQTMRSHPLPTQVYEEKPPEFQHELEIAGCFCLAPISHHLSQNLDTLPFHSGTEKRPAMFTNIVLPLLSNQSETTYRQPFPKPNEKCGLADQTFLLLKRADHAPQGGTWGLPAGKLEAGESPEEGVEREVLEETSFKLDPSRLSYVGPLYVRHPHFDFLFHIFHHLFEERPPVVLDPKEHTAFEWVSFEGALTMPLICGGGEVIHYFKKHYV